MKPILRALIHSLYWLVFLAFSITVSFAPNPSQWPDISNQLQHFIISILLAATVFYVSYFFLIKYFEKRQLVRYLIFSMLICVVATVLFLLIHQIVYPKIEVLNYLTVMQISVGTFIIAQCGSLIRGFDNWFSNIQAKAEIETKNLRNELNMLKSQINPHFLFNTLNNIDFLIQKSPKDASNMLIKLSDMLRYMIYETQTDFVTLQKEIACLQNYIQLQQIRFKNSNYIKISLPSLKQTVHIAPIIFLPFIENAFKHSENKNVMPVIDIAIKHDKDKIMFSCRNYFNINKLNQKHGGVGLENVRRRLELLYPSKHYLHITCESDIFTVELTIET